MTIKHTLAIRLMMPGRLSILKGSRRTQLPKNESLMNKAYFILLLAPSLIALPCHAQESKEKAEQIRRDKIEIILRIQDSRTPHDGKLVNLLSDEDPSVRERATLAYGSIQDSTAIPMLTNALTDPSQAVQLAAAFALGQIGAQLGTRSRQQLEHDLIWNRLYQTPVAERLIEEIGKFGTEDALNDIMIRIGNVNPPQFVQGITMSIARFAIRGITSVDAVRYLLRFTKPAESTSWQVMYALQRIGIHQEIRQELDFLALLYKHDDPLVRMNLATLLGKFRDERTSLDPLQKLADFDRDWRVRVNALKALGNFNLTGKAAIVTTFKREFFNENDYVKLAALSSFANTGLDPRDTTEAVRDAFDQLRYIARNSSGNFLWQVQAEAASTLAAMEGPNALSMIRPASAVQPQLEASLLRAAGLTGSDDALKILLEAARAEKPLIATAALEGLQSLGHSRFRDAAVVSQCYGAFIAALETRDVAIVATSASALGDSLFRKPEAVPYLLASLSDLRLPYDIEAMQEIIATLGKLNDSRAVLPLLEQLRQPDRSITLAAASALQSITGADYVSRIQPRSEPLFTDYDFEYLRKLPGIMRVRLETMRGDIILELYKDTAPFTVMSFLKLASQRGYFRGLTFHRVVPNFVIQGGDPRGDGWGGPGYTIRSEFSPLTFDTGMLGMASAGKDTEGSQFFITQSPQPHLDGRYTIFGKVFSGMDVVNRMLVDDRIYDIRPVE